MGGLRREGVLNPRQLDVAGGADVPGNQVFLVLMTVRKIIGEMFCKTKQRILLGLYNSM